MIDPESDSGSSSSDSSSDSSYCPYSKKKKPAAVARVGSSMCHACGRGPFRSMKLHLLHCSDLKVKFQCSVCKKLFLTESSRQEHYMPLYSCTICSQVFPNENSYHCHQCPKGTKSPLALFCSESMPPACNICKSFFTSEKTLFNHVHMVHTSVVSTKVCIITNPSALTDTNVSPGVLGTAAQSANSRPIEVNQVNGKLCVGQTYAGSLSSPSLVSTSSHADRPCATICTASSAAAVTSVRGGAQGPKNQSLIRHPAPLIVLADATDTSHAPAGSIIWTQAWRFSACLIFVIRVSAGGVIGFLTFAFHVPVNICIIFTHDRLHTVCRCRSFLRRHFNSLLQTQLRQ